MITTNTYQRNFKATTESLKDVRDFFSRAAKPLPISKDLLDQLILAVDEAATNIIKHALKLKTNDEFNIEIEVKNSSILVRLIDYGEPFDPDKIPLPDIEESILKKKRGGLGLYLMRQIMDDVKYFRKNGSNVTELIKYIQ